jgi:hypothetical protein
VEGSLIGTVTSVNEKACPSTFTTQTGTVKFTTSGGVQADRTIDGSLTEYNLTAETNGSGTKAGAAVGGAFNMAFEPELAVTCNNP